MKLVGSLVLAAGQLLFFTSAQGAETAKIQQAQAAKAKNESEDGKLYEEGQQRMREGRFDAAEFTFRTLISVYPESPLVKQAEAGIETAARAQQELDVRLTVRALDLSGLGLSEGDTESLFADHEVRLAAGKAYDPRDVEQARLLLTGYLRAKVRTEVRMAGPHEVDVVLTRVE